jgi:capsid protein
MAPTWFQSVAKAAGRMFSSFGSYEAAENRDRRRVPQVKHGSEDTLLTQRKRDVLTANARDLNRNFSTVAWMIRRHLDYVAAFQFQGRTGNEKFDNQLEAWVERVSQRQFFDVAGRHRRSRFLRLAELRAVLDGDFGWMRIKGGSCQGIEGDRIRNPPGNYSGTWIHGVKVNEAGRAQAYALHKRQGTQIQFDTTVKASNLFLHGTFDRFDQVRGVSRLAAAMNDFRDVFEAKDYALAKLKVEQLFALALYRDADVSAGNVDDKYSPTGDAGETTERTKYQTDFGRGPILLDLDPGDRAEFLESKHPSAETQAFFQLITMVALKALDIPYSFFDESHTNFFGSRGAWLHYERSCGEKRDDLSELLDWWTTWRLQDAVIYNELELPAGMTVADIDWEWVPIGMPWWNPVAEIKADAMACTAGFDNVNRVVKDRGRGEFRDNVDANAAAIKYARSKGMVLDIDTVGLAHLKAGLPISELNNDPPPTDPAT